MSKYNILYIENAMGFGGATTSLSYFLWNLNRQIYKPYVVCSYKSDFWNRDSKTIDVKVIKPGSIFNNSKVIAMLKTCERRYGKMVERVALFILFSTDLFFNVLPYVFRLYILSRRLKVDLVHLNNGIYRSIGGILLAKLLRVPCVCHQRCFEHGALASNIFSKYIDFFIAISESVKEDLIKLGIEPSKISVVYEGIDLDEYQPDGDAVTHRRKLGLNSGEHTVGISGCLVDWKGHPVFLKAMEKVFMEVPNCKALVIGGTPDGSPGYRNELMKMAEDLNISDKVVFTGHRSNVAPLLGLLDIVVHASTLPEPFGRVIIEAMAMKRLVIASRAGGPTKIIENRKNGFLTTPGDAPELASVIIRLLKEKKNLEAVRKAARLTVEERFSIQRHTGNIEKIYAKLLNAKTAKDASPIKVAQVIYGLKPAGLEKVVISLVSGLDRNRFEPIICCLSSHRDMVHELERQRIKTVFLNRKDNVVAPFLPFRLASIFRKEKIKIVHTHNLAGYLYGVTAAILARTPVVIHTQHGRSSPNDVLVNFIRRILSWKVNRIIAVAEILKKQLIEYSRITAEKIVTVPNGVEDRFFEGNGNKLKLRKEFGFRKDDKLVGIIARLDPVKDHKTLLYSFSKVLHRVKDSKLIIVGDGQERAPLERLARELKIENHVFFLGVRTDISTILSMLDVFTLTSEWEGMSLILIEAMASSLPIVATDVGGNPELIHNMVNGILVPPSHPNRLSEMITKVLENKVQARKMGTMGRRFFEEKYTIDKTISAYQEIYDDCINKVILEKREKRTGIQ